MAKQRKYRKTGPKGPTPTKKLLEEGFFRYVKNLVPGRCPVYRCINASQKDKALCHRHHMQRWRAQHPDAAGYHCLRTHAKTRGLAFTITFEDYLDVMGYYEHTKPVLNYGEHISVDRKDPRRGYIPGNIQAMTVSENTAKSRKFLYTEEGRYWSSLDEAEKAKFRGSEYPEEELPCVENDIVPF